MLRGLRARVAVVPARSESCCRTSAERRATSSCSSCAMRAAIVSALARRSASAAISARRAARSSCLRLRRLPQASICCSMASDDFLLGCLRARSKLLRAVAAQPRRAAAPLRIVAQPRELVLAVAQLDAQARQCRRAPDRVATWPPPRAFPIPRAAPWLASSVTSLGAKLFFDVLQRRLRFRGRALELQYFGVQRTQLALHASGPASDGRPPLTTRP